MGQGNAQDPIGLGTCHGAVTQRWSMVANKDNYQIVGVNSLCLDISNGVAANGTPLDLSKCVSDNTVELWALFQAPDESAAQSAAQTTNSTRSVLERHGLMGTFAEDCTKNPSDSNQYVVHRPLDAERVERNQMKSPTVRSYTALVEKAEELTSNEVAMNIIITETVITQMKDWRMHLVTKIDGNRIRLMESTPLSGQYAGRANISAGRAAGGGEETHWLTKCK
jgi:hypothetical protein